VEVGTELRAREPPAIGLALVGCGLVALACRGRGQKTWVGGCRGRDHSRCREIDMRAISRGGALESARRPLGNPRWGQSGSPSGEAHGRAFLSQCEGIVRVFGEQAENIERKDFTIEKRVPSGRQSSS
jgi:hypothetical protein